MSPGGVTACSPTRSWTSRTTPPPCSAARALTRVLPGVSTEVVGPSLSRIYEGGGKHFGKFKHVIEPRFAYAYLGEYDDRDRVPRFDEIDVINAANLGRVSLINRVLAKPADESRGSGREILSLELFQLYSFDDEDAAPVLARRHHEPPVRVRRRCCCASTRASAPTCARRSPTTRCSDASSRPRPRAASASAPTCSACAGPRASTPTTA